MHVVGKDHAYGLLYLQFQLQTQKKSCFACGAAYYAYWTVMNIMLWMKECDLSVLNVVGMWLEITLLNHALGCDFIHSS